MTSFHPTKVEQFAIEAKLNHFFGARVYDRVFPGFEVLEVVDDELLRTFCCGDRPSVFSEGRLDRAKRVQSANSPSLCSSARNEP